MKTYDLHLLLNIRRALYILTFSAFVFFVIVFYFAIKNKDNPIGAEIEIAKGPLKVAPDQLDDKQVVFTVSNGSHFDWNNVRLTVNGSYIVKPGPIVAGDSRTIRIGDLENTKKIPTSLIPTNRSAPAYQSLDPNDSDVEQDLFSNLTPLKIIRIQTSDGRVMYDPSEGVYYRMGRDNKPTTFAQDLKNAF